MRIVPALLVALAATALGAGAVEAGKPQYTNGQLALMVLPKSQLGSLARGLEVEIGSGVQSNAAAAEDTLDPKDTAKQLGGGGRISGYSLQYDDLAFKGLVRGHGVLSVGTSVDLFTGAAAADRYLAKQMRDGVRYDGKYVEAGFRLTDWETSPAKGLGKGAVLIREALRLGDTHYNGTLVVFRSGPLLASVGITRADAGADARLAMSLARLLAKRMHRATSGSLGFQPVFVPQTARKGVAPAGGPALENMALAAADLPKGAHLVNGAYVANRTALAKYVREFDFPSARLGGANLFSVESELNLLRSEAEASGVMVRLRALYGSPDVDRAFTDGFNVKAVKIELRKSVSAGDEAIVLVLRFTVNGRTAHIAQVSMRVGRVVGLLNIGVVGPTFQPASVEPLAVKLGQRIQRSL
jgi:hypothetical protein